MVNQPASKPVLGDQRPVPHAVRYRSLANTHREADAGLVPVAARCGVRLGEDLIGIEVVVAEVDVYQYAVVAIVFDLLAALIAGDDEQGQARVGIEAVESPAA